MFINENVKTETLINTTLAEERHFRCSRAPAAQQRRALDWRTHAMKTYRNVILLWILVWTRSFTVESVSGNYGKNYKIPWVNAPLIYLFMCSFLFFICSRSCITSFRKSQIYTTHIFAFIYLFQDRLV